MGGLVVVARGTSKYGKPDRGHRASDLLGPVAGVSLVDACPIDPSARRPGSAHEWDYR
jgi:hypothetical protein